MRKKLTCPACDRLGNTVKAATMRHHLCFPFSMEALSETYYYCAQRHCGVAYFSLQSTFLTEQLQSQSQIKTNTVCFCFGITEYNFKDYDDKGEAALFFAQLDQLAATGECNCRLKNPAGRGCLKTFKSMAAG
ncbi:MAG: hypothetical protein RPR40_05605 [Bermanella sp.]